MFQIRRRYKGLRWNTIYFAEQEVAEWEKNCDIIEYNYMLMRKKESSIVDGQKEFTTLVTDLTQDEDSIFETFEKNTKYEIRRASREGVEASFFDSAIEKQELETIISFYNAFVDTKEALSFKVSEEWFMPYIKANALWCTTANYNGQRLVEHIYYGDGNRIRLWYSASLFRDCDHNLRNLIGRANRFLHWRDMLYFRECGFEVYDWGGYSDQGDVAGNGAFKKAFGGAFETGKCYLKPGGWLGAVALKLRSWK